MSGGKRPGPGGRLRRMADSDYTSTPPSPAMAPRPVPAERCATCGVLGWDPLTGKICRDCAGYVEVSPKSAGLDWRPSVTS